MEKVKSIHISETGDLVVQLDGGGASVRITPGERVDVAAHQLRSLAEMLERSVACRDTRDVYYWQEQMELNRKKRHCPKCGSDDFKYAIHDKATRGFGLSVVCNDCHHEETGDNFGADAERMVIGWHI